MSTLARMLVVGLFVALAAPAHAKTVILAGHLSEDALVSLSAAAARNDAVFLLDSRPLSRYLKHYLADWKPDRVVAVGWFDETRDALGERLGVSIDAVLPWSETPPASSVKEFLPRADRIVVCTNTSRALMLDAACLAAAESVPLWIVPDAAALQRRLKMSKVKRATVVGFSATMKLDGVTVTHLKRDEVRSAYLRKLGQPIERAVVVNPADREKGALSSLAPWLAMQKKAVLLHTSAAGTDTEAVVKSAALPRLDTLILLANLQAIPTQQRPNPIVADKDKVIDMEPLTPRVGEPFTYAIGRLFHDDRAAVPLMLARQRLMASRPGPRRALIASNPGGSLPLLETFSRNTASEMKNAGWEVTSLIRDDVTPKALRSKMNGPDLFLWEGHHNTLVKEWGFAKWDEPLPPTFVFLQSCLALMPEKVQPLLSRGAVGVLGTSTRTYSGSGGAFSLAFLDACVYDDRTTGDSLRQAKNFLVCYMALKEKRLGDQAKRTGANLRASWAFTLWGDPTFRLPSAKQPSDALPIVQQSVLGNTITLTVPKERHDKVTTPKYQVRMPPNARLAGLIRKQEGEEHPLVPFTFAEVHLPKAPPGVTPQLRSRIPSSQWVFVWDGRRQTGYLLVMSSSRQESGEMRFRVEWPGPIVAGRDEP